MRKDKSDDQVAREKQAPVALLDRRARLVSREQEESWDRLEVLEVLAWTVSQVPMDSLVRLDHLENRV